MIPQLLMMKVTSRRWRLDKARLYRHFLAALEGPFEAFVRSDAVNAYLQMIGPPVTRVVWQGGERYEFLVVSGYEADRGQWGTLCGSTLRFGAVSVEVTVQFLQTPSTRTKQSGLNTTGKEISAVLTPNFFYGQNYQGEELEYRMALVKGANSFHLHPVAFRRTAGGIVAAVLEDLCVIHVGIDFDVQTATRLGAAKVAELTTYQQFLACFWNIDDYLRKQNPAFASDYDIDVWRAVEPFSPRIVEQMCDRLLRRRPAWIIMTLEDRVVARAKAYFERQVDEGQRAFLDSLSARERAEYERKYSERVVAVQNILGILSRYFPLFADPFTLSGQYLRAQSAAWYEALVQDLCHLITKSRDYRVRFDPIPLLMKLYPPFLPELLRAFEPDLDPFTHFLCRSLPRSKVDLTDMKDLLLQHGFDLLPSAIGLIHPKTDQYRPSPAIPRARSALSFLRYVLERYPHALSPLQICQTLENIFSNNRLIDNIVAREVHEFYRLATQNHPQCMSMTRALLLDQFKRWVYITPRKSREELYNIYYLLNSQLASGTIVQLAQTLLLIVLEADSTLFPEILPLLQHELPQVRLNVLLLLITLSKKVPHDLLPPSLEDSLILLFTDKEQNIREMALAFYVALEKLARPFSEKVLLPRDLASRIEAIDPTFYRHVLRYFRTPRIPEHPSRISRKPREPPQDARYPRYYS